MTGPGETRLRALRGAARAANTAASIAAEAVSLYDALLAANGLAEEDVVSLVFSVTADLDALNPARALREAGRAAELPLMVTQEAAYRESLSRVIRVLIHCYLDHLPRHVYQSGAEILRPDRAAPAAEPPNAPPAG